MRLVLSAAPPHWGADDLAYAYLVSSLAMGPEGGTSLPLDALFGSPPRGEWSRDAATLRRALIPNLRTAIISSSFLTAAVVLGELTVARVLLKQTLPQFMIEYRGHEPQGGMGLGLLALVATTALFAVLSLVTRKRGMARPAPTVV